MPVSQSLAPTFGGGGIYGGGQVYGGQQQTVAFYDETGINPIPAGILVTIANAQSGQLIGAGWTQPGGVVAIGVPPETLLIASFSLSLQAPQTTVEFTPDGQTSVYAVTVDPYRSPSLSLAGYAAFEMSKLVRGWYGSDAISPGDANTPSGIAYAIGLANASGLADFDEQVQAVLAAMRLQSSANAAVDSWSLDMVGPMFSRYPAESDILFIARNELMVSRPRCTIAAIQAFVEAFYASVLAGWSVTGNEALGYNTAGALNVSGGLDTAPTPTIPQKVPPIVVWDAMTQPDWATQFGISAPEFVIQIGLITTNLNQQLAYDVAGGFDTQGGISNNAQQGALPTPSATPPDPRLGTMIDLIAKAGGTKPLYLVGQL